MRSALSAVGRALNRLLRPLAPLGAVLKDAYEGMWSHNVSRMAASIAYFGAFSMAPMLVIMVSLASVVFGKSASEGLIVDQLSATFGEDTAAFIQSLLASIYASGGLTVATVLAILLLMWASTRIIGSVRGALNDIWGVHGHGGTGFRGFVVGKLVDLGMVLVVGFMFLASMLGNTAVSALTGYFSDLLPMPGYVLELIGIVFSLLVTTIFLTIIFRVLPNIKVRFVYVLLGASITAVLFSIGNYVIGRYLGRTSPGSAFGAAGSLAVILIWMYYTAHIILFGAEITRAYAYRGTIRRPQAVEIPAAERAATVCSTSESTAGEDDTGDENDRRRARRSLEQRRQQAAVPTLGESDPLAGEVPAPDVDAQRQGRIFLHSSGDTLVRQSEHVGQCHVGESQRGGARVGAGHIGDGIVQDAFFVVHRILVSGGMGSLETAALVHGHVDHHRSGAS